MFTMDIYGFSFTYAELGIFCGLVVVFLYQLYFYLRYIYGVLRQRKRIQKDKVAFESVLPPVSVIVCSKDEADNLRKYLPLILEQDYPDFELIVINDGSTDETDDLLRSLSKTHKHLRTTFVPVGANNISTKKLGLTLGIKAAKNEWLLFTDADCMPEDKYWIALMARNFTAGTEFVLGYGAYFQKKSFINRLITYDTLFIALQYMGMTLARKPYMGVGRNMAYRKSTFFAQKGFASSLNLNSGDDDLMVNKAAKATNVRVEIAPESITWSEPKTSFKSWFFQKERHLAASSYYSTSSKFNLTIEPVSRALFYALFIASLICGNWITQIAAGLLFVFRYTFQAIIFNCSSKHFNGRLYLFTIPVFDLLLPLISLYIMLFGKAGKRGKRFVW